MKKVKILLKASMETRVRRILEEYHPRDEETLFKIEAILPPLKNLLGKTWLSN